MSVTVSHHFTDPTLAPTVAEGIKRGYDTVTCSECRIVVAIREHRQGCEDCPRCGKVLS